MSNEEQSTEKVTQLKVLSDKYTLGSRVLSSSTGDIYTAWLSDKVEPEDAQNLSLYIKFLPDSYPRSEEAMAIFIQEIERIKNHGENCNIISFEQTSATAYLIFGLPAGNFLSDKISQQKSYGDLSAVLVFAKKITEALNKIKSCGLVHGCIGLDSIYISEKGDVILLDSIYVSAKQRQLEQDIERTVTVPNREAIYASPDVCFGRPISEQDDVFSLASISYHLLSGQHPFGGENSVAALLSKVRPKRIDSLTDAQWEHLENGMAFAKESRLETIDDFIHGFDRAVVSKKKSSVARNVEKVRETVLARQRAQKIIGTQAQQKSAQARKTHSAKKNKTPSINIPLTTSPLSNTRSSFGNLQLDLPEWAWIPLSLFSGVLVGAIMTGLAMEFFGFRLF